MKITLPISELITPENYGQIECDAYEIRGEYYPGIPFLQELVKTGKPLIYHESVGIMKMDFISRHFGQFLSIVKRFPFLQYSCHFAPACRRYQIKERNGLMTYQAQLGEKILSPDEIYKVVESVVKRMRSKYDGQIALENTNFYPFPEYSYVCEPDLISKIFRSLDIGFVLDLAHAWITARNKGMEYEDYLMALPLDKVTEIHVSEPSLAVCWWKDAHSIPKELQWARLRFLLLKVNDPYVVVEYYGDFDGIKMCYEKLNEIKREK